MTAAPVRAWHLALLPAVLVANYLVMTARHEAVHGAVVLAFGGEIADVHLWPPRGGTFSWITFRLPLAAPAFAVPLQAAAPSLAALALLGAGTWAAWRLRAGLVRANVVVTAVLFPACELAAIVVGYGFGGGDLVHVLGTPGPTGRWALTGLGGLVVAAAASAALWGILADRGARRIGHG